MIMAANIGEEKKSERGLSEPGFEGFKDCEDYGVAGYRLPDTGNWQQRSALLYLNYKYILTWQRQTRNTHPTNNTTL